MSTFQRIRLGLSVVAQIIGVFWLSMAVYFVAGYYMDVENRLRHEYQMGMWIGILYATGFSLGSALLAISVKNEVSRPVFRVLTLPALFIGSGFLVLYLGIVAYDLVSRT